VLGRGLDCGGGGEGSAGYFYASIDL
jgi:hypothetical protein